VDSRGRVYVADTGNKRIVIFDVDGNYLSQFGQAGMEPGQFDEPVGIALDSYGTLYVSDTWNSRVQSFAPTADGINFTPMMQWDIAGWFGQSLDNKPFIAVSPSGDVFVTDPEMYRVLEFSSLGNFVRTWGDIGTGSSNFGLASGIAVDARGRVWVSDAGNHRIMRFTLPVEAGETLPPSPIPSAIVSPLPSPEVSPSPSPALMETCKVMTGYQDGYLNLRVCAGTGCTIVGWIPEGSLVSLLPLEPSGDWIAVQWGDLLGWIFSNYCLKQPSP
jgi:DNA-binding beta-propeller fold protein YncE